MEQNIESMNNSFRIFKNGKAVELTEKIIDMQNVTNDHIQ